MVEKYLNELVGSLGVLYVKLHQYHWYIEGTKFFTLHEKFEEYYDETTEYLDEIAERMLALEQKPVSTLKEFIEHSWITESPYTKDMSDKDMVKSVLDDFKLMASKLQEGLDITADANDDVTNDLFVGMKHAYEKHAWMLRAYLK